MGLLVEELAKCSMMTMIYYCNDGLVSSWSHCMIRTMKMRRVVICLCISLAWLLSSNALTHLNAVVVGAAAAVADDDYDDLT